METSIILQLLLIVAILFLLVEYMIVKRESSKKDHIKPKSVERLEHDNPQVPPHVLHYVQGSTNTWGLVQLALYKMYINEQLLDYDNIVKEIEQRMIHFKQPEIDFLKIQLEQHIARRSNPNTGIGTGTGIGIPNDPEPPQM